MENFLWVIYQVRILLIVNATVNNTKHSVTVALYTTTITAAATTTTIIIIINSSSNVKIPWLSAAFLHL